MPTVLDFLIFYIKMTKYTFQYHHEQVLPQVGQFFSDVTTLVYDLAKATLIDANLFKYKPSVLAAALLFLGF